MNQPKRIPFTPDGYAAIKTEQEKLTLNRPEILNRLQLAREMGDLSENGAYKAARQELGDTDRRLRYLNRLLRLAQITENQHSDTIQFGSRVSLKINSKIFDFTLVNGYESNPGENKLSDTSPIGQAIIGKKAGDEVQAITPTGTQNISILTVE